MLYGLAGACYLLNSSAFFLAPSLQSPIMLLPCLLGEGAVAMWLLVVGVNDAKWRAVAGRA